MLVAALAGLVAISLAALLKTDDQVIAAFHRIRIGMTEAQAEDQLLAFVSQYVTKHTSPMCGNTIGQDRRFL